MRLSSGPGKRSEARGLYWPVSAHRPDLAGAPTHGQGTCDPAHRTTSSRRRAADLRDRRRQPQPDRRRGPADRRRREGRDRLDPRPARGGRGVRGRGGGAAHRPAGGLRRLLRAGKPAPDQRPLRRQPLRSAGAGHRLAHPEQTDRQQLLPGNPPGPAVQRVLGLLRADQHRRTGPARHAQRHPARRRPPRRRRRDPSR